MAEKKQGALQRLLGYFKIAQKSDERGKSLTVAPGKPKDKENPYSKIVPIEFPTQVQAAYQYFLSNFSTYNSNSERIIRNREMESMVSNDGIMNLAALIYTEETYEVKDGQRPIQLKAKDRKLEKEFYQWLDDIGFTNNVLRDMAWNLTVYGDAFLFNHIDLKEGVIGITPADPSLIKDRIEFNMSFINNVKEWESRTRNLTNKYQSLQQISKEVSKENNDEDYSLYYQSYFMGWEVKYALTDTEEDVRGIPPWGVSHARLYNTKSEFFPFGRPLFINSLAIFKSYKTTEMLIDMLRVASFPKEIIKVQGGETLTPLDRIDRLHQVKEMIENISPVTNSKDDLTVGDRLYSMEGLFEYDVMDTNVSLDSLGDLELKRENLILSTGIPDTYLIPSKGSGGLGGESAEALYYNNKIFQRRVEGNKSAILECISNLFRIHLTILGREDGEKTEFELFMPVNADMYSSDKYKQDSEALRLASDMMNNLGQALGMDRGEILPEPVVRDIFKQYLTLDDDLIDKWIDKIVKKVDELEIEAEKEAENGQVPNIDNVASPLIIPTDAPPAVGTVTNNIGTAPKEDKKATMATPDVKVNLPKPSKGKKKESATVKKFLEGYKKGNDILIREAYFKSKRELGFTNGWLGQYVFFNDTYKILHESKFEPYNKASVFSMIRKEKEFSMKRKLEEKDEGNQIEEEGV